MLTILVVEDNPLSRKLLRITLEGEGYRVLEAPDGATALAHLAGNTPDLILQDLHLPDMDGFELVRRIRATPSVKGLPILALSGFLARLEEAQASEVGFNGFLVKPIAPSQLVETLRLYLPHGAPAPDALGLGRRLLLAHHSSVELNYTEHFLTAHGFRVAVANTGQGALAAILANPPELLVADLLLPDLDGLSLCQELRRDPDQPGLPVVLVSGHALDPDLHQLVLDAGANAVVSRKVGLDELSQAILAALAEGPHPPGPSPPGELRSRLLCCLASQSKRMESAYQTLVQQCTLQSAQLTVLGNLCEALAGGGGHLDAVLAEVLGHSLDAAGVSKGALFLVDPQGRLVLSQAIGYLAEDHPILEAFFGRSDLLTDCLLSGTIRTPTGQPSAPHLSLPEGLSAILVPVIHAGQSLGVLFMVIKGADLRGADPLAFARALAAELAQALTLAGAFSRLALSEERYRGIVESTTEGVCTLDLDRRLTFVNQRISDLLGYPAGEMLGRSIFEFIDDGQYSRAQELSATTLGGLSMSKEMTLKRKDGTELWVHLATAPLLDAQGQAVGAVALVGDRTEQKKMQEQLMTSDRMASVGTLAAGVAHEINNPLAVVLANLQLAQLDLDRLARPLGEDSVGPLRERCRHAEEAAQKVAEIVRDLKLFSRSEEDRHQPLELRPALESTLRMAWNEIRHRAHLVKDFQPVPRVLGNESRLGQVFLNLLVNAAQAIPEGQADRNEIKVATRMDGTGLVAVDISDTGSGMAPEVLKRLFTPFFTTKPVGVGTGLGLSICQRIITAMGGEIRVTSQVGQGTTFTILLPGTEANLPPAPAAPPAHVPGRRARLLVVDDEPMVAGILQQALSAEHEVVIQTQAQDAYEQIRAGARFDLIFCDLMMPSMTGMELYAELRKVAKSQAEAMVFMSGGAFTSSAMDFLAGVPNVCIDKPFDIPGLRRLVKERTMPHSGLA